MNKQKHKGNRGQERGARKERGDKKLPVDIPGFGPQLPEGKKTHDNTHAGCHRKDDACFGPLQAWATSTASNQPDRPNHINTQTHRTQTHRTQAHRTQAHKHEHRWSRMLHFALHATMTALNNWQRSLKVARPRGRRGQLVPVNLSRSSTMFSAMRASSEEPAAFG